jgi:transcriptional regulator with XRE-family HTH domain
MQNRAYVARVAEEVRAAMARQSLTGSDLARHLGISQSTASRRLAGAAAFGVDELACVAAWLGVALGALLPRPEQTPADGCPDAAALDQKKESR